MTEETADKVNRLIRRMSNEYGVNILTEEERIKIVNAIGLNKGHWYKCPNGHYYCIGECGGAMEKGTCPDCGKTIGGRNHELEAGNLHAKEMDGSAHAAWSNAANLANYDPADLAWML